MAYSGVVAVWAMKAGDFVAANFAGTTSGLQAAVAYCAGGGSVYVGPGTIEVSDTISLLSGISLRGAGLGVTIIKLANASNVHVIAGSGLTDVMVSDMTIDGNKANQTVNAAGVRVTTCTNVRLVRIYAHDCEQDGFYISGSTDVTVSECISINNGRNGYSCGDSNGRSVRVSFQSCMSSGHSDAGDIGFALEPASFSSVIGCKSVGDFRGITCLGASTDDSTYNTIEANQIIDFLGTGINVQPGTSGSSHNVVADNVLKPGSAATEGIVLTAATDVTVRGNRIGPLTANNSVGIVALTSLTRFKIDGNHIHSSHRHGIQVAGGVRGTIDGNTVRNPSGETDNTYDGIRVADTTDTSICGNNVHDDRGGAGNNMNYAIQSTGSSDRLAVTGNQMQGGNQSIGIALVGTANVVSGNQPQVVPTVASATTITLPSHADVVFVSGSTTITSVTASRPGRTVTLIFTGALIFTDGSNLKLAGNFTSAGATNDNDTITLVCDGTNWFEVARSLN